MELALSLAQVNKRSWLMFYLVTLNFPDILHNKIYIINLPKTSHFIIYFIIDLTP